MSGHRPCIGITSWYRRTERGRFVSIDEAYCRAVSEAGGLPVVLPVILRKDVMLQYVRLMDGMVFSGGEDIPPEAYGQTPAAQTNPLPRERFRFERRLLRMWLATGKPVLGICLGIQLMNVFRGGTLVQDIPTQVGRQIPHRDPAGRGSTVHTVRIEPGTRLRSLLPSGRAEISSSHHQAVARVGRGLTVAARSEDGVVEALELDGERFGIFVQWHPERMTSRRHKRRLFGALVNACRTFATATRDPAYRPAARGQS
jgi:putative glutamine amidotransferase